MASITIDLGTNSLTKRRVDAFAKARGFVAQSAEGTPANTVEKLQFMKSSFIAEIREALIATEAEEVADAARQAKRAELDALTAVT
jgi:hypothetical protein